MSRQKRCFDNINNMDINNANNFNNNNTNNINNNFSNVSGPKRKLQVSIDFAELPGVEHSTAKTVPQFSQLRKYVTG